MLRRLGDFLRAAREAHGWSQEDLAFEAGVHRTYVGGVERGEYNVTVLTLHTMTQALGISMADAVSAMTGPPRRPRRS
jgi:transcriptional regulator with XRE-family HTH domain